MLTKDDFLTFICGKRVGNATTPHLLKFRSSNSFIITTIAFAVFTDIFLYTCVVPLLPFALTVRAGILEEDLQRWTAIFLSVYGAALAVGSPLVEYLCLNNIIVAIGYYADRTTSRRTPLLLGLLALGASTASLCAGSSLPVLITGRTLQGLSASVVWTVGLVLLAETVKKEEMCQAMGYVFAATSVGQLAGPLLGGVVYAKAGYYAVYSMGFAFVGLDILLRLLMIEKHIAAEWLPPDSASLDTSEPKSPDRTGTSSSEGSKEISRSQSRLHEPAALALPSELEMEASGKECGKCTSKLPPVLALLKIPRLLAALFGCFVDSIALSSFDSVLPLYVKERFHWTSTGAGLIFICLVVPALASPLVGYLSDRYGTRLFATAGLLGTVPFWVLLRLVTYDSLGQKVLLCGLLFGMGICLTIVMPPILAEVDYVISQEEKKRPGSLGKRGAGAQAFGLFNVAFAVGTMIGPLWAGFVVKTAGWATMGWSLAILSGVAAVISFIWTGGRIILKQSEKSCDEIV